MYERISLDYEIVSFNYFIIIHIASFSNPNYLLIHNFKNHPKQLVSLKNDELNAVILQLDLNTKQVKNRRRSLPFTIVI